MILLCAAAAQASAAHVQAELLANVSAIQPGKPFLLGVRLSIDPGWHVYWKNPGDAGLPTRVKFTLPDGFTAGPLQFPTPRRFAQPGNIVAFGYENSVMLLTKITPPQNLPPDFHGQFQADVNWLVCSTVCIPGKATVSLNLATSAASSPANKEIFDDWTAQLPVKSLPDVQVTTTFEIAKRQGFVLIIWPRAAPDSAEFIPGALDDYNITDAPVISTQNQTEIRFTAQPLAGKTPGSTTLESVLGYLDNDGNRRGLIISVALPAPTRNNH